MDPVKEELKRNYFGSGKEVINGKEWDWENFKTTEGFPVSSRLLDWVIGQEKAIKEIKLALDEWIYKLKWLQKKKWYKPWLDPYGEKPTLTKLLTPGPYILLLGEPGTGKSLIGRGMAEYLTELYKKHKIKRFDVLCWPNKIIPSNPRISIHPPGEAKKIIKAKFLEEKKKSLFRKTLTKVLMFVLGGLGVLLVGYSLYSMISLILAGFELGTALFLYALPISIGSSLLFVTFFIWNIDKWFGGGTIGPNIGGAARTDAPKLLVNNSTGSVPFVDATGHTSAQLFGSIAWDPLQTGGLGTPEHQRVSAGDVHRACLGILYIDEIKNLNPFDAVTLLSVLEDGCLPVTMRSMWHGADTAAMAVSTEPIPALFFLLAAGNYDSIGQIHPALMDRITGYGRVVRMNVDMPNTVENRRKYVQFISQEVSRFHLPPFTRDACIEVIEEARRRSNKKDALVTKFRPLISVIKTAAVLARNRGSTVVEAEDVRKALEEHCKTIQRQLLEHYLEEQGRYLEIKPQGTKVGTIYGLAVIKDDQSGEEVGTVLRVKGQMVKKKKGLSGFYKVTGVAKDAKWIQGSIEKVRSVILKKYGVDVEQEYCTHIDFSQSYAVDGPSAGVTMTLLLCSLLEKRPIRQDVAVTGEINISAEGEIEITAVGGIHEKIKAAEAWGFKKVVIPKKNYENSIEPSDYKIEVVGASTLDEYLKEVLA